MQSDGFPHRHTEPPSNCHPEPKAKDPVVTRQDPSPSAQDDGWKVPQDRLVAEGYAKIVSTL